MEAHHENISRQALLIFLIGARASGKSTLGRLVAERLGLAFVDADQAMHDSDGLEVDAFVARSGWPAFRARESAILRECARPRTVVATGGGVVLDPGNCAFMRATGMVFFLDAPASLLALRLAEDAGAARRPSLTGLPIAEEAAQILAERESIYRAAAHHVVNAALPLAELARELSELVLCHASPDGLA
jgi:shikimate kinase